MEMSNFIAPKIDYLYQSVVNIILSKHEEGKYENTLISADIFMVSKKEMTFCLM